MFNLFQSKKSGPKTRDIIWMTQAAKFNGIIEAWKKDQSLVIICWFHETLQQLQSLLAVETSTETSLLLANQVHPAHKKDKPVIFAEHYPMRKKEMDLFEKLSIADPVIHSALDEPLFEHFGGAKISQMMKQLGMKENDPVEHKMITQSIANAQDKIEKKLIIDQSALSQKEWMNRNILP